MARGVLKTRPEGARSVSATPCSPTSPSEPVTGSAYELPFGLPRNIEEAVRLLRDCRPLIDLLGDRFILAYTAVKESELDTWLQVISSWEREHLLLNV